MSIRHLYQDLNAENVAQDDDFIYEPPLCGLIVTAPGAVHFTNGRGEDVVVTIGADSVEPVYIWGQITKVVTDTEQDDSALTGLRVGGQTDHVNE